MYIVGIMFTITISRLANITSLCDVFSTDQSLDVANEYTWCMRKPRLSNLVINFNVWNFTNKVRMYV